MFDVNGILPLGASALYMFNLKGVQNIK